MAHRGSRICAYLTAPLLLFASGAEAGVGDSSEGALSSFGRLSPAQTVQFNSFGQNCYYADGWNGRGWYRCGDEWNDSFGWVGPFNFPTGGGAAIRRHHHQGAVVLHPQAPNPVYPGAPSRRLGAGGAHPSFGLRTVAPAVGGGSRFHQFGAGGLHTSPAPPHVGVGPVSPGVAGGGFHGLGGSRFHGGVGVPHIGSPVSPGFIGGGGFHAGGGIGVPHIGGPALPSFAGAGGFHPGGGIGASHIGGLASPGFVGAGGFHAGGGIGAFQGGSPIGQGGIGHR